MKRFFACSLLLFVFASASHATLLLGQQSGSTPVTESVQGNGGDVTWRTMTAVATGTSSTVQLRIGDWSAGTATGVKVVVYDSGGSRICISGIFAPADGTGLLNKPITCSITSGQDYSILIVPDTAYVDVVTYHDLTPFTMQYVAAGGFTSYTSPAATLPTSSGPLSRFPLEVWLDGTTSGGTFVIPTKGPKGALGGPVGFNSTPRGFPRIPEPHIRPTLMAANDDDFERRLAA